MENKKINVKIMEQINDKELELLNQGIKKIKGFDFLIDAQFRISRN